MRQTNNKHINIPPSLHLRVHPWVHIRRLHWPRRSHRSVMCKVYNCKGGSKGTKLLDSLWPYSNAPKKKTSNGLGSNARLTLRVCFVFFSRLDVLGTSSRRAQIAPFQDGALWWIAAPQHVGKHMDVMGCLAPKARASESVSISLHLNLTNQCINDIKRFEECQGGNIKPWRWKEIRSFLFHYYLESRPAMDTQHQTCATSSKLHLQHKLPRCCIELTSRIFKRPWVLTLCLFHYIPSHSGTRVRLQVLVVVAAGVLAIGVELGAGVGVKRVVAWVARVVAVLRVPVEDHFIRGC